MAGNTDPRARRTRRRLIEAYRSLVADGHATSVSVLELTRRAGVNRTSFYAHFASTEELAAEALTEVFSLVAAIDSAERRSGSQPPQEVSRRSLAEVARFMFERRTVYAALMDRRDTFASEVEDAFAESALRTLRRGRPTADPVITARFIAAGVMGVIGWWLRQGPDWTPEQLAEQLARVIPADFTRPPDD